jgi:hypothetical protein
VSINLFSQLKFYSLSDPMHPFIVRNPG